MKDRSSFNLTPDPKVLVQLTRTPLQPLDALCELIDNSIDGFQIAKASGSAIDRPLIAIEIPNPTEVDRGDGALRVRDNGPGLAPETAEKALRAGYSGNNPYGSLGLFGMGFNISTGKLGRRTRFRTIQDGQEKMLEVVIDLEEIQKAASYDVPFALITPDDGMAHGTVVDIDSWWPKGDANHRFARSVADMKKRLPDLIGRRYASILRGNEVRITVNGEPCKPYEHCAWSADRFVKHASHGQIPARLDFDEVVENEQRCSNCFALREPGSEECAICGSASTRTVEHRIRGWVGIQRFDDETMYGIDLIRNGRAIRVAEKTAFFEFADELGVLTKDYPIDQPYGRIIGEVHLDHVPVDFQKQDFQRSTPEWKEAIEFLRGRSSLQPNKDGASENKSPVFKLFQGYRKVRNVGRRDMYMGQWEEGAEKPKRVSRDLEHEYYERFIAKEPGYFDDEEWWKLVEAAERRPVETLSPCPDCGIENPNSAAECSGCGYALIGKNCIQCGERLAANASNCPSCGAGQIVDETTSWICEVCSNENPADVDECGQCEYPRGTPPLASTAFLKDHSSAAPELSLSGCSVQLADGTWSTSIDVEVRNSHGRLKTSWDGPPVPVIAERGEKFVAFVDVSHDLFKSFDIHPQFLVAEEVAHYIYVSNTRLSASHGMRHSLAGITSEVIRQFKTSDLDISKEGLQDAVRELFQDVRRRIAEGLEIGEAEEVFDLLSKDDHEALVRNFLDSGRDMKEMAKIIADGEFIEFIEPAAVANMIAQQPEILGDAVVSVDGVVAEDVARKINAERMADIARGLQDCASYIYAVNPSAMLNRRTRAVLDHVKSSLGT